MEKYGMGDVRQSRKKWDAAENQPTHTASASLSSESVSVRRSLSSCRLWTLTTRAPDSDHGSKLE